MLQITCLGYACSTFRYEILLHVLLMIFQSIDFIVILMVELASMNIEKHWLKEINPLSSVLNKIIFEGQNLC